MKWVAPGDPSKGFKYLYLSDADHARLIAKAGDRPTFKCEQAQDHKGQLHWRLTDVIGSEDGLGVECLSGSGVIASTFARAFREGFTITLVNGRTVGIGAYLARLGRR